jgi:hypothetical protein
MYWSTAAMSSALEWITRITKGYARLRISSGRSRRNVLITMVVPVADDDGPGGQIGCNELDRLNNREVCKKYEDCCDVAPRIHVCYCWVVSGPFCVSDVSTEGRSERYSLLRSTFPTTKHSAYFSFQNKTYLVSMENVVVVDVAAAVAGSSRYNISVLDHTNKIPSAPGFPI